MSSAQRSIREVIQQMSGTHLEDKVYLVACTIVSVDIPSGTCEATPINGNAETDLVQINMEAEVADGLLLVPAIDSTVLVIFSDRNDPYIILYSDIDGVFYSGGSWQFGDGSFGGLVNVITLSQRIARLEQQMNTHAHSGVTTGAGVSGTNTTPITQLTTRADLENPNVTHGN
jgi:hypothetical protein